MKPNLRDKALDEQREKLSRMMQSVYLRLRSVNPEDRGTSILEQEIKRLLLRADQADHPKDRDAIIANDLLARIRRCQMKLVVGGKMDPPSDDLKGDFNL